MQPAAEGGASAHTAGGGASANAAGGGASAHTGGGLARLLREVELTEVGAVALPDRCGFGPLFWAVVEREPPGLQGALVGANVFADV